MIAQMVNYNTVDSSLSLNTRKLNRNNTKNMLKIPIKHTHCSYGIQFYFTFIRNVEIEMSRH